MNLKGRRESSNVEDRRGMSTGAKAGVGGLAGIILIAVMTFMQGGGIGDVVTNVIQQGGLGSVQEEQVEGQREFTEEEQELATFSRQVLASTEDVWTKVFQQMGKTYYPPTLVLFTGSVNSACGQASASVGPFYCSGDQKLYIDLSFFSEMKSQVDKVEANKISVRLELLADYYAGVWGHYENAAYGSLEAGDIEEAIDCAQKIGDNYLQKKARGYVQPESFTHGTSAQRMKWLKRGLETGDMRTTTFGISESAL